jgi:hypothetical protein
MKATKFNATKTRESKPLHPASVLNGFSFILLAWTHTNNPCKIELFTLL